jgi:hypothetical protein
MAAIMAMPLGLKAVVWCEVDAIQKIALCPLFARARGIFSMKTPVQGESI